jgi:hypothetical protein
MGKIVTVYPYEDVGRVLTALGIVLIAFGLLMLLELLYREYL